MEELLDSQERIFKTAVERVLAIEGVTWGTPPGNLITGMEGKILVYFRGQLLLEREEALSRLTEDLSHLNVSPIYRREGSLDGILLIEDPYFQIVDSVFQIEEVHWGDTPGEPSSLLYRQDLLVRYQGQLRVESEVAFNTLTEALHPIGALPAMREVDNTQEISLIRKFEETRRSNPWINLILFVLTLFSVLFAGTIYAYAGPAPDDLIGQIRVILDNLALGIPFAIGLLSILLAHEFGHYIAGRFHGAQVTLPYFIPFPISILGTLGAFIQLKAPTKNKKALFDLGAAGPLAGLAVAIPVLLIGLSRSHLDRLPLFARPGEILTVEGNSILYLLAKFAVFGQFMPEPLTYGQMEPIIYWLRYFFTGRPEPFGATDVIIDPLAWAGWVGLLVTAINLIPAGQLDGGHITYTLFGKRARILWPFIIGILLVLGFFWSGWWLWAGLIFVLGRFYAEPMDQITPLDRRRKVIAVITLIIFLLVFTPVPLRFISYTGGL